MTAAPRPQGIAGSTLAGPFPVGAYAAKLRDELRKRARVQLFGEVWNFRASRAKVYFELRDGDGALPCSMWRDTFDEASLPEGTVTDGTQVIVAGGPDYYPGSRTSSPAFSFAVSEIHVAGEGDLLARLEVLRRQLAGEGLFERQKRLIRPGLPRYIGVVTGEGGKARDDILAGLRRRGWGGRLVWAFVPVQDRHAAGAVTRALQDLAAINVIDVVIVARGGGSLADLFAFSDETLCRTVALLRAPVIASVGHHTDRMLIDDVAAVACSTPTHAAEAAVPCHPVQSRERLAGLTAALQTHGRRAVLHRATHLATLSRAPAQAVARHRNTLLQTLRELRASARRRMAEERDRNRTKALVLARKTQASAGPELQQRRAVLDSLAAALAAHDPQRTLARGYAIVDDGDGGVIVSAAQAREVRDVHLFFSDGPVPARVASTTDRETR